MMSLILTNCCAAQCTLHNPSDYSAHVLAVDQVAIQGDESQENDALSRLEAD